MARAHPALKGDTRCIVRRRRGMACRRRVGCQDRQLECARRSGMQQDEGAATGPCAARRLSVLTGRSAPAGRALAIGGGAREGAPGRCRLTATGREGHKLELGEELRQQPRGRRVPAERPEDRGEEVACAAERRCESILACGSAAASSSFAAGSQTRRHSRRMPGWAARLGGRAIKKSTDAPPSAAERMSIARALEQRF